MGEKVSFTVGSLNTIYIQEFDGMKLGEMLYHTIPNELSNRSILGCCKFILNRTLLWQNEFEVKGNPKTLFLFSNSYSYRKDLLQTFDYVREISGNHIRMLGVSTKRLHIGYIRELGKLFIWNREIKKAVPSFVERLYVLRQLYGIYLDYKEYSHFVKKNGYSVDKLVTLCDVHAVDYYFTSKFNSEGKTTVTLQHGVFSSTANSRAYGLSQSKHFLANSQFAVDEAVLSGHGTMGLHAAGLPSFVGREVHIKRSEFANKKIGAILEGEFCHEDNMRLISALQDFCKKNDKELYIKLHPVSDRNAYDDVIDNAFVKAVYGKEKGILEFAEIIDVAIVRNTTSLLELISQGIPSFIFVSEKQKMDVYKNAHMLRFETQDKLKEYLDAMISTDFAKKFDEMKKYFGDGEHAEENYQRIFSELGIL